MSTCVAVCDNPCCVFQAPAEVNPHLFTIATLTGHVIRAYSDQYTVSRERLNSQSAINIRNTEEAVLRPQYSPRLLY